MPKLSTIVLSVVIALVLIGLASVIQRYVPAIRAPWFPPPKNIAEYLPNDSVPPEAVNETNVPLKLPAGFRISVFAKNLPGARVMQFDQFGNMWVSRTSAGVVTLLEIDRDTGKVLSQDDVFRGLQKPHGLAFDPEHPGILYIAEENRIRRTATYSEDPGEDVIPLPSGGGHFTRTIGFGPDKKLYVSIGSSCNVCRESDERRAAVLRYDPASGRSENFAKGLRNAVFFIWDAAGQMLATEMGRDFLGDNLPPDEINIIKEGAQYGWPNCYGKNAHDDEFDKNTYIRNPCMEPFETPSYIDIPAHSAPLGLAVIPSSWPGEYRGNLLVSYHGSWNRSTPTGYKVVRFPRLGDGNEFGPAEDFITGWLTKEGALGRPVDIVFGPDGAMYLSDDKAGVIYKIAPVR